LNIKRPLQIRVDKDKRGDFMTVSDGLERKAVTLGEAAKMLGCSTISIRRAVKSGRLRAMRLSPTSNGAYRIPIDAIDEFLGNEPRQKHA